MTTGQDEATWVIDRDELLGLADLPPAERAHLERGVDDLLKVVIQVVPPTRIEKGDPKAGVSTSAHLRIPGTKYHLNVTSAFKTVLVSSLQVIAKGFVLDQSRLIEAGMTFGAQGALTLLGNLTKLDERQLIALDAICDVMRAKKIPNYRPSTKDIAKKLKWKAAEVDAALRPIVGRVVDYQDHSQTWRIIF